MKLSSARLKGVLALAAVIGVLVLTGLAWAARAQSMRLEETAGWAERTRSTVAAIDAVTHAVLDAESGQRSYLIGSPAGLVRYRAATDTAFANLATIERQIDDDPQQQALLQGLKMAVRAMFERLERAVAATPTEPAIARAIVLDSTGRQIRADISSFAGAMVATEGHRFDERIALGRDIRQTTARFAAVALLMLLLVALAAMALVMRELKLRGAIAAALEASRQDLQRNERRLRAIADNMPACIAYVDDTETYRFTNAVYQTQFGIAPELFIGKTVTEMMGAETRAALAPYIESALAGRPAAFEKLGIGRLPDATFMVSYRPDVNAAGGVDGYFVMAQDISARKQAEIALADSEQRLRTITDNLPATIVRIDRNLRCTYANEQFRHVFGIDPASLLGTSHRDFRGEKEWADVAPHVEAALRGEPRQFEVRARIQGQDHWVQQSVIPDVDANGRIVGYLSVTFDITQRKRQEEALRKSESFLERTGRMAGIGGWELQLASGEIVWSAEMRRIHGVDADYHPELESAIAFYPPATHATIRAMVHAAATAGTPWDMELPLVRADGRRIWVRTVGSAEFVDGTAVRLVGVMQDISDRVGQRLQLKEANDRIALATESGGIGIWELDIGTRSLIWDPRMYHLFGADFGADETPAQLWRERVHPADMPELDAAMKLAMTGNQLLDRDFRVVLPGGAIRHLRGTARAMHDADGKPQRLIGANWDITELRQLAADLAEDRSLLSVTLESIGDAVITTDAGGAITWLNPVAERLTGWTSREAMGRPLLQVFHIVDEQTREPAPDPVADCLAQGRIVGLANQTVLLSRNGEEFGIQDSASPIRTEDGRVLGVVLVFHDVSEQRRLTGEMSWRATHDALTGLVNRAEFEARLVRLLQKAHADDSTHALMYIDLDQFKLVNDACGHAVGDQLLQQMSRMLADAVRHRDTLARLGGDEFAIIMEHSSPEQAQQVAQKICDRMDDFRFMHEGQRFRIGTSIGLVPVDRRWQTTAAIQQAADTSCYAAKEAGRNRVHA